MIISMRLIIFLFLLSSQSFGKSLIEALKDLETAASRSSQSLGKGKGLVKAIDAYACAFFDNAEKMALPKIEFLRREIKKERRKKNPDRLKISIYRKKLIEAEFELDFLKDTCGR